VDLPVARLRPSARLPVRAYPDDAAFDLHAAVDAVVKPLGRAVVPTGIALGLPPGVAALTLPRSGLAARHGVTLLNTPGLIDPGYRGEVQIVLHNTDPEHEFVVRAGDRIAQLLVVGLLDVRLLEVERLDGTARGARGFGSTGTTGTPATAEPTA
jgi:dUTP pyrophosphatase